MVEAVEGAGGIVSRRSWSEGLFKHTRLRVILRVLDRHL